MKNLFKKRVTTFKAEIITLIKLIGIIGRKYFLENYNGLLLPFIVNKSFDNCPYILVKHCDDSFVDLLDNGINRAIVNSTYF